MSSSISNESVTVVVTRRVKSGYESQYENWLNRLLEEAKSMKGYIGAVVQKPAQGSTEYTSIFRFDNVESLKNQKSALGICAKLWIMLKQMLSGESSQDLNFGSCHQEAP
jgi:antibiotic biosynthesis monooxygenase (ABM) superfamily enzyme